MNQSGMAGVITATAVASAFLVDEHGAPLVAGDNQRRFFEAAWHDAQLSGGQTHLRNIKVTELKYRSNGSIVTVDAHFE
jgi:hypothetical protein